MTLFFHELASFLCSVFFCECSVRYVQIWHNVQWSMQVSLLCYMDPLVMTSANKAPTNDDDA